MKKLYIEAIKLTGQIETIEFTISELRDNSNGDRISIRTDNFNNDIHLHSDVRPNNYIQFLHAELKDLEKTLKSTESEIKRKLT